MDSTLILVVIGVIAMTFGRSEALDCYQCASTTADSSYCRDPFNSTGVTTVPCTTNCFKSFVSASGQTTVTRGCSPASVGSDQCEEETESGVTVKVCVCKKDKCNDGQMIKPTAYSVIIGAAMATVATMVWIKQS
jgi:hypothetical protein